MIPVPIVLAAPSRRELVALADHVARHGAADAGTPPGPGSLPPGPGTPAGYARSSFPGPVPSGDGAVRNGAARNAAAGDAAGRNGAAGSGATEDGPARAALRRLARDLAAAATAGRTTHRFRTVLLARCAADLAGARHAAGACEPLPEPGRLAYLFSGQSSQRAGMGLQLAAAFPRVDAVLDRVAGAVDPLPDGPLRTVLGADGSGVGRATGSSDAPIDRTENTQPALLAVALGLVDLLDTAGIRPDLVCGHSFGEIAAAAAAGVWSVEDAARLAAARGRIIAGLPPGGGMVAVEAGEAEVAPALAGTGVSFSAVHGPESVVLAGPVERLDDVVAPFAARGTRTAVLAVGGAYHSPAMAPVLEPLRDNFSGVASRPPSVPLVGNATGALVDAAVVATPEHWVRHCRETVRWSSVMTTLRDEGTGTFLEVGPSGVLSRLAAANLDPAEHDAVVPALHADPDEPTAFLTALARLDARGHAVDWPAVLDAAAPPT